MELSKQVVFLELYKRLKELGVKQESLCYWYPTFGRTDEYHVEYQGEDGRDDEMVCAAFTVAELGEMLPEYAGEENDWSCTGSLRLMR